MRIGIDVMGGDYYPSAPIEGAILANGVLDRQNRISLFGPADIILTQLMERQYQPERFDIIDCPEFITMAENPAKAVLQKQNATINVGMRMLKEGAIDAFVSAGNTGAILTGAVLNLGCLPTITRPTIGAVYPNTESPFIICDVGANTECKPEQLVQFAYLGYTYMQHVFKLQKPRVALLNIGEEKHKGPANIQQTYALLERHPTLPFVGNIEGWDLFAGKAEVIVCDGFTGNILLKFIESLYPRFRSQVKNTEILDYLNFETIGGLPLLGLNGAVIVGHGISTPVAFRTMILNGLKIARSNWMKNLNQSLA
jgi:glycerol-3-phosphate acyltransferase PlsX